MKCLLIQIRENKEVLKEEYDSFLKFSGLEKEEFDSLNLFYEELSHDLLNKYDGIFIGGASAASVLEPDKFHFLSHLYSFINRCIEHNIPTFASCFGFQAAVIALGGEIIDTPENFEMGTVEISLRESAKNDILLKDMPSQFYGVSVHQQKAIHLPETCESLAYTKECEHIFKVKNKPFWAFQFHPEVDKKTLIERLAVYQDKYTESKSQYENVISQARETVEANLLVKKFVDRVLKTI